MTSKETQSYETGIPRIGLSEITNLCTHVLPWTSDFVPDIKCKYIQIYLMYESTITI